MIKGVWPFATGSVHASHGYLAAFYDETDDTKVGMALVPKDELIARDDWDAMGLAGHRQPDDRDGRRALRARGALQHARAAGRADRRADRPGPRAAARRAGPLAGQRHGRGARHGRPRDGGVPRSGRQAECPVLALRERAGRPVIHHAVGRAHMQIRAAGMLADAAVAELDRCDAGAAGPLPEREVLQYHTDVAYVWDACSSAIETLFRASGASAIMKRQPLQLIARNCRAGSLHAALQHRHLAGEHRPRGVRRRVHARYRRACSNAGPELSRCTTEGECT